MSSTSSQIGVHLASTECTVQPGQRLTLSPIVANNGPVDDAYQLSVAGLPDNWIAAPAPLLVVPAGAQREASLTLLPPRHFTTRAGLRRVTVRAQSQSAAPGQMGEAGLLLTVGVFGSIAARLRPERQAAGQPFQVTLQNHGNLQDVLEVTCHTPKDELEFDPDPGQALRLGPGQTGSVQFSGWPRRRPLLGGERAYPFLLQVASLTRQSEQLQGAVTARGWLPGWVLLVGVMLFIAAFACMVIGLVLTQGL